MRMHRNSATLEALSNEKKIPSSILHGKFYPLTQVPTFLYLLPHQIVREVLLLGFLTQLESSAPNECSLQGILDFVKRRASPSSDGLPFSIFQGKDLALTILTIHL